MVKGAVCKTAITSSILVGSFPLLCDIVCVCSHLSLQELPLEPAA